jgi:RNA polymerase sigma factor (sigma-70 family)
MNELNDAELLAEFVNRDCEQAFAVLVNRHIRLVHSVALRHTANPHHAEEITQAVFIILARKAPSLRSGTILSGWLYQTARLAASNFQRAEIRRVRREQEVFMDSVVPPEETAAAWIEMAPLLDDAMAYLGQADRATIVLRYFENRPLQEVGLILGVEERAAQKRVSRSLEKLRRVFKKLGVITTSATIIGAISAHSVQAAPAALAATISATALKGSAAAGSTMTLVKGTLQIMRWMKTKMALGITAGTVFVLAAGAAIVHHRFLYNAYIDRQERREKLRAEQADFGVRGRNEGSITVSDSGNIAGIVADRTPQKRDDERKALSALPKELHSR